MQTAIKFINTPDECDSVTIAVMTASGNVATESRWEVDGGPQTVLLELIAMACADLSTDRVECVVYYHNA